MDEKKNIYIYTYMYIKYFHLYSWTNIYIYIYQIFPPIFMDKKKKKKKKKHQVFNPTQTIPKNRWERSHGKVFIGKMVFKEES